MLLYTEQCGLVNRSPLDSIRVLIFKLPTINHNLNIVKAKMGSNSHTLHWPIGNCPLY